MLGHGLKSQPCCVRSAAMTNRADRGLSTAGICCSQSWQLEGWDQGAAQLVEALLDHKASLCPPWRLKGGSLVGSFDKAPAPSQGPYPH